MPASNASDRLEKPGRVLPRMSLMTSAPTWSGLNRSPLTASPKIDLAISAPSDSHPGRLSGTGMAPPSSAM